MGEDSSTLAPIVNSLLEEGKVGEAVDAATRWSRTDPGNAAAWGALGKAWLAWKDYAAAIEAFGRAAALEPAVAAHHSDLADAYAFAGHPDRALQEYERAVSLDSGNPVHRAGVAGTLVELERTDEATGYLEQCVAEFPDGSLFQSLLAYCLLRQATRSWVQVPEGSEAGAPGLYATSQPHVAEAEMFVRKVEALKWRDEDLAEVLQGGVTLSRILSDVKATIALARRRVFCGFWRVVVVALAWGVLAAWVGASSGKTDQYIFGGYCVGAALLYYLSCLTPQFVLNRRAFARKEIKIAGWAVIFLPVVLPFIVAWNFAKNYLIDT